MDIIEQYITQFDGKTATQLTKLYSILQKLVPASATTSITYGMPTFKYFGNLVHFAGYAHHIGFYPSPSGIDAFKQELFIYKTSKGAIQFPLDQKLPQSLIKKIVQFRVKEQEVNNDLAAQNPLAHKLKRTKSTRTLKTCDKGHQFYKVSDCNSCPVCEALDKPSSGLLAQVAAPVRRALENAGIKNVKALSQFSEKEILALHGIGRSSIPVLVKFLDDFGFNFKKE